MSLTICVMLWAAPGREHFLAEYEDQVLERLAAYGAQVLIRVRSQDGDPTEVQLLRFPSEAQLDGFLKDPERLALADLREQAIARTELRRVEVLE
jgi:uncharacterized protein (DUF1330 family)